MYAVMWSEHCSYKSSRIHLDGCPPRREWVLVGPGENAGVVDVGDGIAAALRIESHNHPSAIEPYQGAATGVGGILRDIFTMGARPIALMDPLRFGPLDDARSRWIAEGVVSGISGYGNSVGVPTVGGETVFDETYAENPLVNVLCLGMLPDRPAGAGRRPPAWATWRCCSARPPGATASAGSACWPRPASPTTPSRRGQAPERAGGRPLRGEAADRGLPGAARRRPGGRHPGPRRRRPDLRHQRDGVAGRRGHGRRRHRHPAARAGHGALRDPDQRVPGAHAGHRRARRPRRRCWPSASAGRCGPASSAGSPPGPADAAEVRRRSPAHPRRLGRRGAGRRARPPRCTRTPRSTTGPCRPPAGWDAATRTLAGPAAAGRATTWAPICSDC